MAEELPSAQRTRSAVTARFAALADTVVYRWTVERDTWVGPSELEAARAFLAETGLSTRSLPDGSFGVGVSASPALSAARLFVLAIRHLRA